LLAMVLIIWVVPLKSMLINTTAVKAKCLYAGVRRTLD
jgi:hypothetical protein